MARLRSLPVLILLVGVVGGGHLVGAARQPPESTKAPPSSEPAQTAEPTPAGDAAASFPELPDVDGLFDALDAEPPTDRTGDARSDASVSAAESFGAAEVAATSQWATAIAPVDWLGPLAPVALSPFFGITLLSGLAIWGPDFLAGNSLLSAATPLRNPTLFWVFLGLTCLTSVPRFTKVSKPFAQAVDFCETYSVIFILLVIKFMATTSGPGEVEPLALQAGFVSFSLETMLAVAAIVNIIVINAVKYFFEFLIWLTPIPMLDALFETCNKVACAALMGLYAFSPLLATIINLILLTIALVIFRWSYRRVQFYRSMVLDPVLSWFFQGWGHPKRPELVVFPRGPYDPFPAKGRLVLRREATGWSLVQRRWFLAERLRQLDPDEHRLVIVPGWLTNNLRVTDRSGRHIEFVFSHRYRMYLPEVARSLGAELAASPTGPAKATARVELT